MKHNYDISNLGLLAIKLALEEWRYWLEGAKHQFEVITDHRSLEYLQDAKRLNPNKPIGLYSSPTSSTTSHTYQGIRTSKRMLSPEFRELRQQEMAPPEPIHPPAIIVRPI